jgi:hypothetical protein
MDFRALAATFDANPHRLVGLAFALATVVGVAAAAAPPVDASVHWFGFATPTRNIVCNRHSSGADTSNDGVDCVLFSAGTECQKTWTIRRTGRTSVHCYFSNIGTDVSVLRYGQTWARGGARCVSERRGLTCTNLAGHGFFLSRAAQRVF